MSVENFDGNGFADQPSVIYSFDTDDGREIRELVRSTTADLSEVAHGAELHRPGDVIARDTTKSSPTNSLPELDLPGQGGLVRDDCGKDIPAFACLGHDDTKSEGCGKPVYVGRTCSNPTCERDWAAAIKRKVTRTAGKLEGFRRALYARHNGRKDIDFNHVVASPPKDFAVDSETPLKRTLLIIKTLLEKQWAIEGFVAILHPYRIKKEYRADQYEHDGAEGEGDMTWKDVLNEEEPYQYLTFEPHFHLLFPAPRASFDYSVAEAVEAQSGWLFHRITKGEESNVSVEDLDDLVHQLTYCYSHSGVRQVGPRDELASQMKGELHNCYIPDGVEEQVLAMFCDAAPKLLGVRFANMNKATCSAEISRNGLGSNSSESSAQSAGCDGDCECGTDDPRRHPLHDIWNPGGENGPSTTNSGGNPWPSDEFGVRTSGSKGGLGASSSLRLSSSQSEEGKRCVDSDADESPLKPSEGEDAPDTSEPAIDARSECGGTLRPMYMAEERLEDDGWCQQAAHVSGLRDAHAEWENLVDNEQEKPWVDIEDDDDDLDDTGSVIPTG